MKTMLKFLCIAVAIVFLGNMSQGQNYHNVYLDSISGGQHVPYCKDACEYVKIISPKGVKNISWLVNEKLQENNSNVIFIITSGFGAGMNGEEITCQYDGGKKSVSLHAMTLPKAPKGGEITIYNGKPVILDAENQEYWGFNKYKWSNGSTTQKTSVMEGKYTVAISNVCGGVTQTWTVINKTPKRKMKKPTGMEKFKQWYYATLF